jgi:protein gp37
MNRTKIEWTRATWNPVTGCTPISEGCEHCYARRMAYRLRGRAGYPADDPFRVTVHRDRLEDPLRWRKPKMVFVCSMGDLFHPDVPFEDITRVFDTMASWRWPNKAAERRGEEEYLEDPGHTFQVLTKRPERIHEWLWWLGEHWPGDSPINVNLEATGTFGPNIWVGTTLELSKYRDRVKHLLEVPAAVRFVSCEPLLGPMPIFEYLRPFAPSSLCERSAIRPALDWVIVGGETGPGARPMDPAWARSIRDQCVEAEVPFFFKRMGSCFKGPEWRHLDGVMWEQYPREAKP